MDTIEKLRTRASLYDTLAYYQARAEAAFEAGNVEAAGEWAKMYHRLKKVMG